VAATLRTKKNKEQYANALEILGGKKTALKKAAGLLLENEKMDREELRSLMDESSD
jgi:ATP-dependent Zn protease